MIPMSFFAAALEGFRLEKQRIEEQMALLQKNGMAVKCRKGRPSSKKVITKPTRVLSPAARKRISDAQKKRWADYRRQRDAKKVPSRLQAIS